MPRNKDNPRPKAYQDPAREYRPVRKIHPTACSVTGRLYSRKANKYISFESHLEKRFLLQVERDSRVSNIVEQPITIIFTDEEGVERSYTPDFLIMYRSEVCDTPRELVECKYFDDLQRNWAKYKAKFEAAEDYAAAHGMRFRVVTDRDLSMAEHQACMTLRTHISRGTLGEFDKALFETIRGLGKTTPGTLLQHLCVSEPDAASVLRSIWALVASGLVHADLSAPPSLRTQIRTSRNRENLHE